MKTLTAQNVIYLRPKRQNKTVDYIGIHMIQKVYIEEINKALFHVVMGDEFTSSSNEVLAVSK